jgi:Flp pilus assembly protein TadD
MGSLIRTGALVFTALVIAPGVRAQEDAEQTLRTLREEVRQNPDRLELRVAMGNAAVGAGQYDLAVEAFRGALAAVEGDAAASGDLHLRLGETYRRKGDLAPAAAELSRARELLPSNPAVAGTLALVLDQAGKFGEAERAYRTALQLDPENTTTMNNLAFLLAMHTDRLDEALALAERCHEAGPDSPDFNDTLATVHEKLGNLTAALAILLDLVERDPSNDGLRGHLAAVLERRGSNSAGEQSLLQALKAANSEENQRRTVDIVRRVR